MTSVTVFQYLQYAEWNFTNFHHITNENCDINTPTPSNTSVYSCTRAKAMSSKRAPAIISKLGSIMDLRMRSFGSLGQERITRYNQLMQINMLHSMKPSPVFFKSTRLIQSCWMCVRTSSPDFPLHFGSFWHDFLPRISNNKRFVRAMPRVPGPSQAQLYKPAMYATSNHQLQCCFFDQLFG